VAKLVVVNGWGRLDPHTARCFEIRLDLLRDTGPRAYVRAQPIFLFPATWISEHSDELDAETEAQLAHFQGSGNLEARLAALQAFYVEDRLEGLRTPLLALAAKDDMLVPWTCSRRLADGAPGGALATMGWGGHACNATDPEGFNRLVLAFLGS